jgi:hypothetical protein
MVLDLFLQSKDAAAVIDVGCCYHAYIDGKNKTFGMCLLVLDGLMGLNGPVAEVFPRSSVFKSMNPVMNWSTMKVATNSVAQYTTWDEKELKFTLSGLT